MIVRLLKLSWWIVAVISRISSIIFIIGLLQIMMKLNVTKCKEIILDFGRVKRNFPPLLIDNTEVERVNSTRILGVTIQTNMNWNEHVRDRS
jgi:hypothetical protein